MGKTHILHVEDDPDVREFVGLYLKGEGFQFHEAGSALEALEKIETIKPHLILLDVRLPDVDGFELCKDIRSRTNVPILFLSGKDSEIDRVLGLNIGGDDYIGKPFKINELIARIKVHIRRHNKLIEISNQKISDKLKSPSIKMNKDTYGCYVHGEKIQLTAREFELLYYFMSHPNQVLNIDQIIERLWGLDSDIDSKAVLMHISNLRKKLKDNPRQPEYIVTLRGIGYKFNEPVKKV